MKKFTALAFACLLPACMSAGYNSLLIRDKASVEHLIDIGGLEINFNDGSLKASNPENTLTLLLDDVESMEFSDRKADGSGVSMTTVGSGNITVFSMTGVPMGVYQTPQDAAASLDPGIYVVRYEDGLTAKIAVR